MLQECGQVNLQRLFLILPGETLPALTLTRKGIVLPNSSHSNLELDLKHSENFSKQTDKNTTF
jgi:hypothetical protein